MGFSDDIKMFRQKCLLSQEAFAKEIGVSFATVNRWETGKTAPSYKAIKKIKEYCQEHRIEFDAERFLYQGEVHKQ